MSQSRTIPMMRAGRGRGSLGRFFAVGGTLVAVAVVIALIVSWASDQNNGMPVSESTLPPTAPGVTPAPAASKPPASAAPARPANPGVRVQTCDPIFGNGIPHQVATSATDG